MICEEVGENFSCFRGIRLCSSLTVRGVLASTKVHLPETLPHDLALPILKVLRPYSARCLFQNVDSINSAFLFLSALSQEEPLERRFAWRWYPELPGDASRLKAAAPPPPSFKATRPSSARSDHPSAKKYTHDKQKATARSPGAPVTEAWASDAAEEHEREPPSPLPSNPSVPLQFSTGGDGTSLESSAEVTNLASPREGSAKAEAFLSLSRVIGYSGSKSKGGRSVVWVSRPSSDDQAQPGRWIAYPCGHSAFLLNLTTGEQLSLLGHTDDIVAIAASRDGALLATGQRGSHGFVRVWSTETCQCLALLSAHAKGMTALAFSSDRSKLVGAGKDMKGKPSVVVWSLKPLRSSLKKNRFLPQTEGTVGRAKEGGRVAPIRVLYRASCDGDIRAVAFSPFEVIGSGRARCVCSQICFVYCLSLDCTLFASLFVTNSFSYPSCPCLY